MPFEESLGFRGFSAKADGKADCYPLAKASGNIENTVNAWGGDNMRGGGDKRPHGPV
jgi:hypothetical protein